ncbi:MAG: hypothetical protein A2W93_06915 [Bacteroidetes bacterium GWF2_43_63]|nr:MAG: hypothetical protein A2W94_07620 [Bacteroidetes bacterium GWE2_42_42]OFY53349.1 MAG: hypothetical protein A2W93_06915 [Bacteroidetes bacterium GWF2_43_63]HBG71654.1 hypothetical protein [Bacteroidales bacterium]HCB61681.1 hypothetical protein [Bacteroidales bacterium]HCY22893.1 hypothetical protein [Bacteroidales bacterium]
MEFIKLFAAAEREPLCVEFITLKAGIVTKLQEKQIVCPNHHIFTLFNAHRSLSDAERLKKELSCISFRTLKIIKLHNFQISTSSQDKSSVLSLSKR